MNLNIAGYAFEGPYQPETAPSKAGVYVPVNNSNGQYVPLDVGETHDFSERLPGHERTRCWWGNVTGTFGIWLYTMPGSSSASRRIVEQQIRSSYRLPCGDI